MNTNNTSTSSGSNKKNVTSGTQFNSKAYDSNTQASGFQEKIMTQIKDLGDSLERAGEKVERSGWEMIGQAISKLGNSLEHLQDKNPSSVRGAGAAAPNAAPKLNTDGGNDSQAF